MLSQLSAAASPPADPAQVARSRAEGDAVIAKAGVADLFENVTAGAPIRLRHKPSGYVCGFDPGKPGKEIQLFAGLPRGDDVECRARLGVALVDTFITRPPKPLTLQQAMGGYAAAVKQAHPDVRPYEGKFAEAKMGSSKAPQRLTARFTYQQNGHAVFSRLSVAVVNGWALEQRMDAPPELAFQTDLMADIVFGMSTAQMAGALAPNGDGAR